MPFQEYAAHRKASLKWLARSESQVGPTFLGPKSPGRSPVSRCGKVARDHHFLIKCTKNGGEVYLLRRDPDKD